MAVTTHREADADTMAEAEAVTQRVHEALAHHDVDHATVELCPGFDDRDTHLNEHAH